MDLKINEQQIKSLLESFSKWDDGSYARKSKELNKYIQDNILDIKKLVNLDVIAVLYDEYIQGLDGQVYRTATREKVVENQEDIIKGLKYLNEKNDDDCFAKTEVLLKGKYSINHFKKAFWSPILQAKYPDKLPNWNNKTETFLDKIGVKLNGAVAEKYRKISEVFLYFKSLDNSQDFFSLNHFMHYCTEIKEGNEMLDNMLKDNLIISNLRRFIKQAATEDLTSARYNIKYRNFKVRASFGQGIKAHIPWVGFEKEGVAGISVSYLYFKEKNILILAYGINEENPPSNGGWVFSKNPQSIENYFQQKFKSSPSRYGESLVYKIYNVEEFDRLDSDILLDDLHNILDEFQGQKSLVSRDDKKRYWLIAAGGTKNDRWDDFKNDNIVALGWDLLGDLNKYDDIEAVEEKIRQQYLLGENKNSTRANDRLACWEFSREMKIGDKIFVKRGLKTIFAYGTIVSDYIFDNSRSEYKHVRKVRWSKIGDWEYSGEEVKHFPVKTLTNITEYEIMVKEILKSMNNAWIFQGNPERFNVQEYLKDKNNKNKNWSANQQRDKMEIGDRVFFWQSGDDAGLYAQGNILTKPYEVKDNKFGDWKVGIEIKEFYGEKYISREVFLKNEILKTSKIIKQPQGSNFLLTGEEKKEIYKLLNINTLNKNIMSTELKSRNRILYGPPGTGKTYNTVNEAVKIIDGDFLAENKNDRKVLKEKFAELQKNGQIEMVTFHQSYGYEEFVEGIKANTDDEGNISYEVEDGIFKRSAKKASVNYQMSREGKVDFDNLIEDFAEYVDDNEKVKISENTHVITKRNQNGDIQSFVTGGAVSNQTITVKVIERDYSDFLAGKISDYKQVRPTQQSKRAWHGNAKYYFEIYSTIKKFQEDAGDKYNAKQQNEKNFVLVIDEINRGNISKIFGELITLIEDSKRFGEDDEVVIKLPYSGEEFSVPSNLYIIGTMNTADRSIALLDTAIRRRFDFQEMMPDTTIEEISDDVDGINVRKVLKKINERIEMLFDRDHMIGHAYFIGVNNKEELDNVMRNKIIPLLQEYFYDDWEKIQIVLGDHEEQKNILGEKDIISDDDRFVISKKQDRQKILGFGYDDLDNDEKTFEIKENFVSQAYTKIYGYK